MRLWWLRVRARTRRLVARIEGLALTEEERARRLAAFERYYLELEVQRLRAWLNSWDGVDGESADEPIAPA